MLVPRTEHTADRLSWDCRICDEPWPCTAARADLTDQFAGSPGSLGLFMASCMYEAIEDHRADGAAMPADLYERMLGWVAAVREPGPAARRHGPGIRATG